MSLVRYKMVLTAESPVAILRSRASSQFVKTLDYLPGSTIRGAFAEIFINKRGTQDDNFQRIFVDEKIRFSDFLPGYDDSHSQLLPNTARACKRHGLRHPESLTDQLLEQILRRKQSEKKMCPTCGEPLDRVSGYISKASSIEPISPGRQLRMHVGISRITGSAMHGLLFSYEMLTEGKMLSSAETQPLRFTGNLTASESEAQEIFEALWNVVPQREHLSVGKARTRGLGELSIESIEERTPNDDLNERWKEYNDKAYSLGADTGKCYFSITLNSHLSLRDHLGRPVLGNIRPVDLGLPDTIERCAAFLTPEVVSGWNAAQGLPKPDIHALGRGGVMAFCAPNYLESELVEELRRLESDGVGEHLAKGFGQLTVCDPFHLNTGKVKQL